MTDAEIVGPFIMFASTDYYSALKMQKVFQKHLLRTSNKFQVLTVKLRS